MKPRTSLSRMLITAAMLIVTTTEGSAQGGSGEKPTSSTGKTAGEKVVRKKPLRATHDKVTRNGSTSETRTAVSHSLDFNVLGSGILRGTSLTGINILQGAFRIEDAVGSNLVMPSGTSKVGFFFGPRYGSPADGTGLQCARLIFQGGINLFSVTRPGVKNGASTPAWQMSAFDVRGKQVGEEVGEGDIVKGSFLFPGAPADFVIRVLGIRKIQICSRNDRSTFNAVPLAAISWISASN